MTDVAQAYLAEKSADPFMAEYEAAMSKARDKNRSESAVDTFGKLMESAHQSLQGAGVPRGVARAPANIATGLVDAAKNAVDFLVDMAPANEPDSAAPSSGDTAKAAKEPATPKAHTLADVAPDLAQSALAWRNSLNNDRHISDDIVAGVAGFLIPFGAYLKAAGPLSAMSKVGQIATLSAADAVTTAATIQPHTQRFADLLRMTDPQSKLVNAYIDYLADDPSDSDLEGRWKNVVDNQVAGLAIAGVLKTGGIALKRFFRPFVAAGAGAAAPATTSQAEK